MWQSSKTLVCLCCSSVLMGLFGAWANIYVSFDSPRPEKPPRHPSVPKHDPDGEPDQWTAFRCFPQSHGKAVVWSEKAFSALRWLYVASAALPNQTREPLQKDNRRSYSNDLRGVPIRLSSMKLEFAGLCFSSTSKIHQCTGSFLGQAHVRTLPFLPIPAASQGSRS